MNSWSQNQSQPMGAGQMQFNPYTTWNQRLPIYSATPIHGEMAAWQFLMGPNSEIYLPDDTDDIIWWIRTDNNGNRTVKSLDVKLHEEKTIDLNDLAQRLAVVEELINGKLNKPVAQRNANSNTTTK